jgi:DNA-binding CsgD family transcriptional regulator
MTTVKRLDALVTACYDASLGRGTWNRAMADIATVFKGTHSTLVEQEYRGRPARVIASHGFGADSVRAYEEYFKDRNVLMDQSKQHLMRPGVVRTGEMMCPDRLLLRSEYYNDFMRPISVRHLLGTTVRLSDGKAVQFTVWRSPEHGTPDTSQLRAFKYLAPHVERALQVSERLEEARGYVSALEDYLSRLSHGAALVNAMGDALFINNPLRAMLQARDGFVAVGSAFAPQDKPAAKAFARALINAASGGPGASFAVARPSGATPYFVLVSRFGGEQLRSPMKRPILVMVSDPSSPVDFDRALLQETFSLTPTECLIACQLANGSSIESVADEMCISVGTVKTHVKRLFSKTGTHRQTELVRLLLLGRAWP